MKRKLATQLLHTALDEVGWTEDEVEASIRTLQVMAEYKYDAYEIYQPGRLFLEHLYLWLLQFQKQDRGTALAFIRDRLIFVSDREFRQLADVLYHDVIRKVQVAATARMLGVAEHLVSKVTASPEFRRVQRATLYVGMSDGSRIDYFRRQNLGIDNEQVIPYYMVGDPKLDDVLESLRNDLKDGSAKFELLFLMDDFCGTGRTLLREVAEAELDPAVNMVIPSEWQSRLRYVRKRNKLVLSCDTEISQTEADALTGISRAPQYEEAVKHLLADHKGRRTILKGSLPKLAVNGYASVLVAEPSVFLCPMLATDLARDRLANLVGRLPEPFNHAIVKPAATIPRSACIRPDGSALSGVCEQYYRKEMEDSHTGPVKYGFGDCGLPLVLCHNTPNDSIFLLWCHKANFEPLFIRFERHGRLAD